MTTLKLKPREMTGPVTARAKGDYNYGNHIDLIDKIASKHEFNGEWVEAFDKKGNVRLDANGKVIKELKYPSNLKEAKDAKLALIYAFSNALGECEDEIVQNKKAVGLKLKAARAFVEASDRNTAMTEIKKRALETVNEDCEELIGKAKASEEYEIKLKELWEVNLFINPFFGQSSWPRWLFKIMSDETTAEDALSFFLNTDNKLQLVAFCSWSTYRKSQILDKLTNNNSLFEELKMNHNFEVPYETALGQFLQFLCMGVNPDTEAMKLKEKEEKEKEEAMANREFAIAKRDRRLKMEQVRAAKANASRMPVLIPDASEIEEEQIEPRFPTGEELVSNNNKKRISEAIKAVASKRQKA